MQFILALLTLTGAMASVHSGIVKHYSPGMFATVANNRGLALREDVDGYASTPYCANIGRVVPARIYDRATRHWSPWLRLQVLDCSAPGADQKRHLRQGLILEIDYALAQKYHVTVDGRAEAVAKY